MAVLKEDYQLRQALERLEKWQKVVEWLKTRENGVEDVSIETCRKKPR